MGHCKWLLFSFCVAIFPSAAKAGQADGDVVAAVKELVNRAKDKDLELNEKAYDFSRIDVDGMITRDKTKEGRPITGIAKLGFYAKKKGSNEEVPWSVERWVRDDLLMLIAGCKELRDLDLGGCTEITDVGLFHVSKCKNLEYLNLSGCNKITGEGFELLSAFRNLRRVNIGSSDKLTDAAMTELAKCEDLREIGLWNSRGYTSKGLRSLIGLRKLNKLDLAGRELADDDVKEFSALQHVRWLRVRIGENTSEETLKGLAACRDLETLLLDQWLSRGVRITPAVLRAWSGCKKIREFDLSRCERVDDEALKELHKFEQLQTLSLSSHLSDSVVTDAGLRELAICKQLSKLDLSYNVHVTNAGLNELGACKHLVELDIRGCKKITPLGVEKLKAKNPQLRILGIPQN